MRATASPIDHLACRVRVVCGARVDQARDPTEACELLSHDSSGTVLVFTVVPAHCPVATSGRSKAWAQKLSTRLHSLDFSGPSASPLLHCGPVCARTRFWCRFDVGVGTGTRRVQMHVAAEFELLPRFLDVLFGLSGDDEPETPRVGAFDDDASSLASVASSSLTATTAHRGSGTASTRFASIRDRLFRRSSKRSADRVSVHGHGIDGARERWYKRARFLFDTKRHARDATRFCVEQQAFVDRAQRMLDDHVNLRSEALHSAAVEHGTMSRTIALRALSSTRSAGVALCIKVCAYRPARFSECAARAGESTDPPHVPDPLGEGADAMPPTPVVVAGAVDRRQRCHAAERRLAEAVAEAKVLERAAEAHRRACGRLEAQLEAKRAGAQRIKDAMASKNVEITDSESHDASVAAVVLLLQNRRLLAEIVGPERVREALARFNSNRASSKAGRR